MSHSEERQEFPLDSDGVRPPTPEKWLNRDADSSLRGLSKEELNGRPMGNELLEKEDTDLEDEVSVAYEKPGTPGERTAAGTDVASSQWQPIAASPDVSIREAGPRENMAVPVDTMSVDEKFANGMREEAADLKRDSKLDAGEVRNLPAWAGLVVRTAACSFHCFVRS